MAESGSGHSPTRVTHFLRGVDFPAKRAALIKHAKENKATPEALQDIERMPDHEYETMADVMKGFGESH